MFVLEGDSANWGNLDEGRDRFASDAGECLVEETFTDRSPAGESSSQRFARCMICRGWTARYGEASPVARADALATPAAQARRIRLAARPAAAESSEIALVIESPPGGTVHTRYVEVVGRVGKLATTPHDVIIAIDFSDSTLAFSGVDLDRDGSSQSSADLLERIGRVHGRGSAYFRRFEQSDFDDSILVAELIAARAFAERFDESNTRVGLVFFSSSAAVAVDLGEPPEAVIEAIDRVQRGFSGRLGRTDFAAAIRTSIRALAASPRPAGEDSRRSILILSDGVPTEPLGWPEEAAIEAADEAACLEIRIDAFALGKGAARGLGVYEKIVGRTGGVLTRLSTPGDVALAFYSLSFSGLEKVEMSNLETGGEGEAIRTTPTGRFDGFLELADGPNTIEVVASLSGGVAVRARQVVVYEDDGGSSRAEAALNERLRVRQLRLEFWAEMEGVRRSRRGNLTIRPESAEESADAGSAQQ